MNDAGQSRNMLPLYILEILKKYSDEDHRFSTQQIGQKLEDEYSVSVGYKTIKSNLMYLVDFGIDLEYEETVRNGKDGEEISVYTDWYLNREFTDAELRLLISSLLFSKYIPYNQCKELVGKLEDLANSNFKSRTKYIRNLPENTPVSKQLFYTIEILDEAIEKKKKVSFQYITYQADKMRHKIKDAGGKPRIYKVSPYQMAANNGRFFLVCYHDGDDGASNHRIDYIEDIQMLDEDAVPIENVKGLEKRLDLSEYMAESLYMFSGKSIPVEFKAKKAIIGAILDWFGMDVRFTNITDGEVTVKVRVNEKAMYYWAMQYGDAVEVLEPKSLRKKLGETAKAMCGKYGS